MMMKFLVVSTMLCGAALSAPAESFVEGIKLAKSNNVPAAILVHGSDWNPIGEETFKIFNDPRMEDVLGKNVQRITIDKKQNVKPDKAFDENNKGVFDLVKSIPALLVYDGEGRPIAVASGIDEMRVAGGAVPFYRTAISNYQKREEAWNAAKTQSGERKATLLGQGLELMGNFAKHQGYNPIRDEIKKLDPEDKLGYIGKTKFSGQGLTDQVLSKANKKEFAEAEAELAKVYQNPRLSPLERQQVFAARYALYSRWPEKKDQIETVLTQMQKLAPDTEYGKAAAVYLKSVQGKK